MSSAAVAYDTDDDEATRVAASTMGGLDTGFKAIVNKEPPPESVGMPADEWFVGVNGSPIGPIRLSDLRAKAASGAVTLESLVWRDGYEEWRPLKTFPELVAVVEESLSSVRASMAPFVPSVARPSAPSPSTSLAPRPATPEAKPVSSSSDVTAPIAPPAPATRSTAVTGSAVVTDEIAVPRQRSPYAAWAAIGVALALGLTLGFVIFSRQSEPVVQYVQVPASAGPAAAVPALENAAPAPPPVASAEAGKKVEPSTGSKSGSGTAVAGKGPAAPEPEKPGSGLSGLKGLSGLGASGPSGPSGGTTTPSSGSSQLDGAQVQSTVARYTGSVKRSCWQPALDSRDPNAPTSARVVVTITVAGSGSVQNVTTSGDPRGYPGLANCIAGRVRGWQFPPSSGTTTVNVPFVFAAQ
jgi:hypothetical protein